MEKKRDLIEAVTKDLVADLLYYGRKEDEDLGVGDIENTISKGEITIDDIINIFSAELKERI